jgi:tetratricopeptide (TPR) repeat protein
MLGTIKEYGADRLAEAGESDLARQAHLGYFTELAQAADPHLRRAEQLVWLARLEADHDNISAAMRGAIVAGEAQAAMRLAAAAGWYWWLGGRRAEGFELMVAATRIPGEVTDEVRAVVYALVVNFVSSGRGDGHEAAEWIHRAYQFSQHSQPGNPLLGLVAPLEAMLQATGDFLSAWEPVLDSEDPWVRALARLQRGKLRIVLGQGGQDGEADLEQALAEFRALGERFGISFALSELAEQLAKRGDFAGACQHYEQAAEVVTQVGATEDVIRLRTGQALMYWLNGDRDASAAAMAEAERSAEVVTWPYALVELALARAELARWGGDADEARHQLAVVTTFLGDEAEQTYMRAELHDTLGYLADDLSQARTHRVTAWQAASEAGIAPLTAQVIVGVADLAARLGRYEQAARLLAASDRVRGLPDRSDPDAARIGREARRHLGEERFAEVTQEGIRADWPELVQVTLAADGQARLEKVASDHT